MKGYNDTCIDADDFADIDRAAPVVMIRPKQPAGQDHLQKVRRFYADMAQRATIAGGNDAANR